MPYRIEASPNNRAGCSNKECKDQKIKITKGEIRVGTWVETENFQSWSWRHWGCTTPAILSNIAKGVFEKDKVTGDENFQLIDGWEDLPEVYQETVRNALIEGHVADDDWKGDPECNRPGKRGFRLAGKKKAAAQKADADGEGEETKPETSKDVKDEPKKDGAANGEDIMLAKEVKKASSAKNKKPTDDEKADNGKAHEEETNGEKSDTEQGDEEEKPVKAKRSTRAKKIKTNKSAEKEIPDSAGKANAKAKRTPRAKAAPKEDGDAETQPAKRRGRPPKSAGAAEESTKPAAKGTKRKAPVDDEQDETAAKPKRGRKKAAAVEEEIEEQEAASVKPKRGRKQAAAETEKQDPISEKPKRGRKKATKE
ncbi:hypothetical protein PMG11_02363 [Penicillium brasilianum]|uniref:PARP-type domain-containing protein n=1 Tax=Penicillium brasilianum TaxID=104259 RepID=A0A0F7TJR2_PENBI|nr:hypothetical protein PMG11_02363 [Penicillium brasilianum]